VSHYLDSKNFPCETESEQAALEARLESILQSDFDGNFFSMFSRYQKGLADNFDRIQWQAVCDKLDVLFKCGTAKPIDGPMIGIPVAIRDSDFFQEVAHLFGDNRSVQAKIDIMGTAWNATFADTGLWMGKTFEPVSRGLVDDLSDSNEHVLANYDAETTRIGRNFFRDPVDPNIIQSLGLPALSEAWHLKDRPFASTATGFGGELLEENLVKEKAIPYSKTGGIYLAQMDSSVVPEMKGKQVYHLNYRWPRLNPVFPMTCLVDELVQVADGIYLGQLVYATKHISIGAIDLPFIPAERDIELGEAYDPDKESIFDSIKEFFTGHDVDNTPDYGYQNNGFFLMMDPGYAQEIYADDAFPQLRPQPGEIGYTELGYDRLTPTGKTDNSTASFDWAQGWRENEALAKKFTTFITEASTQSNDGDVTAIRQTEESILQMLQRIGNDISAQTQHGDHLAHFEQLHRLFRAGVAPKVDAGLFKGRGEPGYNIRINGREVRDWYGEKETTAGFDYYHGATLNLHWGFAETFCPDRESSGLAGESMPAAVAAMLADGVPRGPNVLNMMWHNIGKYIFPWAGKSFERLSGRKLSMMVDESADLAQRYPERVAELKHHIASAPHYAAVKNNADNYWGVPGRYAAHLHSGSWDSGMSDQDKAFWQEEAERHWLMGYNLQDKRIRAADLVMKMADMNYRVPERLIQEASEESCSPFVRQGYSFLGVAEQDSILFMNSGDQGTKQVFQFHYRFPMVGGPAPIGYCLDELVELADGLYLGQLIYATALDKTFHSGVDSEEYNYQLFGYFLLLDDTWEQHRQAINLDTV